MDKNTKYQLVDADGGDVYEIMVPQAEALLLDYDKDRRFRLLKSLKERNVPPTFQWDVSYVLPSPVPKEGPSTSGQSSQPLATSSPIVIRATGKTAGVWKDDRSTIIFLQECMKRRSAMQRRTVDECVYQEISDALFAKHINYSSGQLRSKMKSLRRQFGEAKGKGLHGGSQWKFFSLMESIFPVASPQLIVEDECIAGLEHFDSIQALNITIREVTLDGSEEMLQQSHNSGENTSTADKGGASVNGSVLQLNNSTCCFYETVNVDSNVKHDEQPNSGLGYDSLLWNNNDDDIIVDNEITTANAIMQTTPKHDEQPNSGLGYDSLLWNNNDDDIIVNKEITTANAIMQTTPTSSPAKKKKKNGDGSTDAGSKTPRKTPRKAAVQSQLMWGPEATKAFVKLCVAYKEEVQMESPPVEVWKKIFNELDQLGLITHLTWQICRSKYYYMNTFFTDTLLPNNGFLSGVKWPHYNQFCTIHDIPLGYLVPDVNVEGMRADGATLWNDPERCKMLIQQYKERYHYFKGSKSMVRHSTLYSEISGTLNMFEVPCNAKQCEAKIKELEGKFRCEYDKERKTGAAPSSWPFYKDMFEIYGGNSTLEPRFAYTVGSSQDKLLQKCKEVQEAPQHPEPGSLQHMVLSDLTLKKEDLRQKSTAMKKQKR